MLKNKCKSRGDFIHRRRPDDRGPTTAQRMARYAFEAPVLAEKSARNALEDAQIEPERITHLITASCTGFFSPGLDAALIERLNLSRTVRRIHLGFMGCHAAFNALTAARDAAAANPEARGPRLLRRIVQPPFGLWRRSRQASRQRALRRRSGVGDCRLQDRSRDRRWIVALERFLQLPACRLRRCHDLEHRRSRFRDDALGRRPRDHSATTPAMVQNLAGAPRTRSVGYRRLGDPSGRAENPHRHCRRAGPRAAGTCGFHATSWPTTEICLRQRCYSFSGKWRAKSRGLVLPSGWGPVWWPRECC